MLVKIKKILFLVNFDNNMKNMLCKLKKKRFKYCGFVFI